MLYRSRTFISLGSLEKDGDGVMTSIERIPSKATGAAAMINVLLVFLIISSRQTAAYNPVSPPSRAPQSHESPTTPSTAPPLSDFPIPTVRIKERALNSPSLIIHAYQLFPETEYPTVGQPKQAVSQTIEGIELTLVNAPPLADATAWERVTQDWITTFYQTEIAAGRLPLESFTTTLTVTSQTTTIRLDRTPVTALVYTQTLQYSAPETAQSPLYYAQYPFTVGAANVAYGVVLSIGIPSWASVERPIPVPYVPGLQFPTRTPTAAPTTDMPTFSPTRSPSIIPKTPSPTLFPTTRPTAVPTTASPTFFPTATPTAVPTISPPTTTPTAVPQTPSLTPTRVSLPDTAPPAPESESIVVEATLRGITWTLKKVGNFTNVTQWEHVTAEWFESFFHQPNSRRLQSTETTFVRNMSTTFTLRNSSVSSVWGQWTNAILYDQLLVYRALPGALTPEEYAVLPFQDDSANERYGQLLQNSFENWQELIVPLDVPVVPKQDSGKPSTSSPSRGGGLKKGALIGIIVSAVAVCILFTCCAYIRLVDDEDEFDFKKKNFGGGQGLARSADKGAQEDADQGPESAGMLFEKKSKQGDIDELDDGYLNPSTHESETFDYRSPFQKKAKVASRLSVPESGNPKTPTRQVKPLDALNGSGAMNSSESSDDVESDDDDVEEILAPPGKLGVVIDTPDKGYPIVHEVKYSSPIASRISVGDTLLSVDDIDVRGMTALKVSKIIAKRAHQPIRKLIVIRSGSGDDDEEDD